MTDRESSGHTCQVVVGYQEEVPGSDAADPRIRCGEPAVEQLESGMWVCAEHARALRDDGDRELPDGGGR